MGYEEFIGYVNDRYDLEENEWMLLCNILDYIRTHANSFSEEQSMLVALLSGTYGLTTDILKNISLI